MCEWSLRNFTDGNLVMTSPSSQGWGSPNFERNVAQSWTSESEPAPFVVSDERALEHLNPMSSSSIIANTAHQKMADVELSLAPEVHQNHHWIFPIKVESKSRTCSLSLHSPHLMKLFNASYPEGNFGRQTDTDTDSDTETDTDTQTKLRQQDNIKDSEHKQNPTHMTHMLGSVVPVSRRFERDRACSQKGPGCVPNL